MKDDLPISDAAVLRGLGARLAAQRLALNLTQAEVADQAAISKRTVERMEAGATATQLSSFLRVCRVLGLQERLDALIPEAATSPVAQLKLNGHVRKRASSPSDATDRDDGSPSRWVWKP